MMKNYTETIVDGFVIQFLLMSLSVCVLRHLCSYVEIHHSRSFFP